MRSSFISSKHIFSFMLSEIWPFVYPTQYFGKEIFFFSKTKKYWREEGLRSEQLPNFLHILMFLKFSKFKSFIQLNVCILNIAGFFSSRGKKKKKKGILQVENVSRFWVFMEHFHQGACLFWIHSRTQGWS